MLQCIKTGFSLWWRRIPSAPPGVPPSGTRPDEVDARPRSHGCATAHKAVLFFSVSTPIFYAVAVESIRVNHLVLRGAASVAAF